MYECRELRVRTPVTRSATPRRSSPRRLRLLSRRGHRRSPAGCRLDYGSSTSAGTGPERTVLAVPDGEAEHLTASMSRDAGGDHDAWDTTREPLPLRAAADRGPYSRWRRGRPRGRSGRTGRGRRRRRPARPGRQRCGRPRTWRSRILAQCFDHVVGARLCRVT